MVGSGEKGIVNVILKASDVLDCFSEETPELTLAQISARVGMPKSTTLNLLRSLEQCRLIYRNEELKSYCLGYRTLNFSYVKRQSLSIVQHAVPYLEELQEKTGEMVYLTTQSDGKIIFLDAAYASRRMSAYSISGRVFPMHSTSAGKAMLAYMPQNEVEAIIARHGLEARTPKSITEKEKLFEELAQIRSQGYSVDNEENVLGIRCVGVAIRNREGYPTGAMSISGTVLSVKDECIPGYAELLMRACSALSPQANQLLNG
ncbi:MAG: IclR family transcriptional regulator [Oscillospiraceae bacterium]|nr:IclR family transcriptional regulator [Oscillospiraceae bacterium]MBQ3049170.1 IclR family transcriptional regulator [Oscillospiraceae bacterium]